MPLVPSKYTPYIMLATVSATEGTVGLDDHGSEQRMIQSLIAIDDASTAALHVPCMHIMKELLELRRSETVHMCLSEPITIYRPVETNNRIHAAVGAGGCLANTLHVLISPLDDSRRRELSRAVVTNSKLTAKQSFSMTRGSASPSHVLQPPDRRTRGFRCTHQPQSAECRDPPPVKVRS